MVKFSKQFEGQLVPEWKEAFVDYWQLKKDLKKIQVLDTNQSVLNKTQAPPLAHRIISPFRKLPLFGSHGRKEHEVIQVHKKLASSASKGDLYETELLDQFADTDAAKEFFARLDLQLNKVNQFYKGKEKEFVERGECLRKQMDILVELKAAIKEEQQQQQQMRGSNTNDTKDDPSISCSNSCDDESNKGTAESVNAQESPSFEGERGEEEVQFFGSPQMLEYSETVIKAKSGDQERKLRSLSSKMFNCQGKNLKINIPLTTPSRTLSALTYSVWGDMLNQSKRFGQEGSKLYINKTKLHRAEKMIRGAYIELFKGLGYLQTYR